MAFYRYKAMNAQQEFTLGYLVRTGRKEVLDFLLDQKLMPLSVRRCWTQWLWKSRHLKDLIYFFWYLECALTSAQSVGQALGAMEPQGLLKMVKAFLWAEVHKGTLLSKACQDYGKLFPPLIVVLLRQGELSGTLKESCKTCRTYLEEKQKQKNHLSQAMLLPCVNFAVFCCAFWVLKAQMSEHFSAILQDRPLSFLTRLFLNPFDFPSNWISWGIFVTVAGLCFYLSRSRLWAKYSLLYLPWGKLLSQMDYARYLASLAILTSNQVSLLTSLALSANTLKSKHLKQLALLLVAQIQTGTTLSVALKDFPFFPALYRHILQSGETSGQLSESLSYVHHMSTKQSQKMLEQLNTLMPFVFMGLIATFVLFLILAVFVPFYEALDISLYETS